MVILQLQQIQLDEYTYPMEDKEPINDTVYYKKIDLNAMDFSVWVELTKSNAAKPRMFEVLLFVNRPITFLLFEIWRIMAIKTGAVNP